MPPLGGGMEVIMKNKIIIVGVLLLAAILYIVGPNSIFKVCEVGDNPMKCHWSVLAEIAIAIVLLGIAVVYAAAKTAREKGLLSIVTIVNSVVAVIIPSVLIGGCGMKSMACQSRTFPALYVISISVILISIINILFLYKKNKGKA
jgi:hypothetical protein